MHTFRRLLSKPAKCPAPNPSSSETSSSHEDAPNLSTLLEDLVDGKVPCNPQEECPLFNIPAEIRTEIFSYVVVEQNGATAIEKTDYWYRPDYTHYRYIDTALLRTCKIIWLETHTLPRQQIVRRYWCGHLNRKPERLTYALKKETKAQLKTANMLKSRRILPCETMQIFIQMFALEGGRLREYNYEEVVTLPDVIFEAHTIVSPRHLIFTIRYTDWWWWEDDYPLQINNEWVKRFEIPSSMERLTMEFETRNGKKAELEALIKNQISKWEFRTVDGTELKLSLGPPKRTTFIGTQTPDGQQYDHHSQEMNGTTGLGEGEMLYYIVEMDWRRA